MGRPAESSGELRAPCATSVHDKVDARDNPGQGSIVDWTATLASFKKCRMTAAPFDPDAIIEAMTPLLRLTPTPESRAQIVVHLRIAAEQAALLLSAPIDDDEEPSPVFVP